MSEETATPDPARRRRVLVNILLALALVCGLIGAHAVWVNRQALNAKRGTHVSAQLLEDPAIRQAISVYMVDQLFDNVDVQAQIAGALPPRLKPLAGPATGGLREFANREAPRLLASPAIQKLWIQANLVAREQLLKVVEGDGEALSTTGGNVVLDLRPLIEALAERLGIGNQVAALQAKANLPPDAGQIVLMKSSQLDAAQNVAKLIRHLAFWLTVLMLVFLVAAIALAENWRRLALRRSGWVLITVGLVVLLVRRVAGNKIVDALAPEGTVRTAADNAWDIVTELLRNIGLALCFYGVAVVIAAWLAGPTRLATAIRRALAPTVIHDRAYIWGATVVLFLLLLLWAPVYALTQAVGIILTAIAIGVGVEFWCRQIAAEFPDAQRGDTSARLRDWGTRTFRRRGAPSS